MAQREALTYGASEAADMLGTTRSAIYRWANQPDENGQAWLVPNKVRIIRAGQRVLIPRRELDALLAPVPTVEYEQAVSFQ